MKRLFVFVTAILLLFLLHSCILKEKKAGEITTSIDSVRVAMADRNKPAQAHFVFKSTDGGQTWQDISEGLPAPVIDTYGAGGNDFFADDNGLWLSAGKGIYHNKPNTEGAFWEKEIFPNEHSSIAPGKAGIYAYNYGGEGIFQKANGTDVWSPVFANFQEKRIFSVFETAGGTIFIGSDRGLFKSTNGGKSWKQLPIGGGGKIVASDAVLLATSEAGILRSTDDGDSWAVVISEGGVGIDVERIEGGFAAINYSTAAKTRRIRTSYDGGKTWQPIDAGFPGQAIIDSTGRPIQVGNPAQGNAGSSWHPKEASLPLQEYKTSIIQVGENFFCGHTNGIYRSSDNGKTWKLVRCAEEGKMFKLYVSGNVIYAIQTELHC
jgi:photosystem II stability/assembly factor-like uncharacterized protein